MLPRLRAAGMSVSELRPVPGVRPAAVLARALAGLLAPELGEVGRIAAAEELAGLLETGADVPAELRGRVLARADTAGHVLFVDQLEEYAGAGRAAARDLFGLLVALAGEDGTAGEDGAAALRVVATARPDSLDALLTAGTSDLVSDAVQFLAPLAAEDLERAVTAPVDAVPGLWFEPGLPERIVADAGDEPGRMTLVQFALTELWRRRSRSMLTHAAYDGLGGVAGALIGYADETVEKLPRARQDTARRLFVQLARPDADAFRRRPGRITELAPELAALARELAPSKLLVLSRDPDGSGELVDLAHEALTRLWPRLRSWLTDSRDFRAWQEQLRADQRRWEAQQREPARLLSGTDLTEAERRLAAHPADVSADERAYIRLSRRHSRRGARLKQSAVGALAVLMVLALVLGFSTWQSLRGTRQQLRTQAAGLLAQAAEDRPGNDPATALQLALAAWHTQQTPKTREALLHQYARGQYVVAAHPGVWRGQATGMDATPDGRTLVVVSKPSGGDRATLTVVTGALEGRLHTRRLGGVPAGQFVSAVSPDGRLVAMATKKTVRLWHVTAPERPVTLRRGKHAIPDQAGATMDFSSDGKRLLFTMDDHSVKCSNGAPEKCVPAFAEAWEVPSGKRLHVAANVVPRRGVVEAAFTKDPGTVAVARWAKDGRRLDVRDLATGRRLYSPGQIFNVLSSTTALVREGGEAALTAAGDQWYIQELGRTPGRKTAIPDVTTASDDATVNYSIDGMPGAGNGLTEAGYIESALTEVRTGRVYRTRLPTSGDAPNGSAQVAAVRRKGGGLTVLVPVGTSLMAVRAVPSGSARFRADDNAGEKRALAPDGHAVARVTGKTLEILNAARTRLRSVRIPEQKRIHDWMVTWTADAQRVVVWSRSSGLHRSYAAANLEESVPLPDTVRGGKSIDTVAGVRGSEFVLLTEDGKLARLDAADGRVLTRPFLAHHGPNSNGPLNDLFTYGQLIRRPGRPGQVAVVTRAGGGRGEVMLWDVRAPRRIAMLKGPALGMPYSDDSLGSGLVFSADGSRLAVQHADGQVRLWDADRAKPLPERVSRATSNHILGFGPDGTLVTFRSDKGLLQVYDLSDGSSRSLTVTDGFDEELTDVTTKLTPDGLLIDSGARRRTLDLRPEAQFRTLCAALARDYTKSERKLLPEGTPPEPPCS